MVSKDGNKDDDDNDDDYGDDNVVVIDGENDENAKSSSSRSIWMFYLANMTLYALYANNNLITNTVLNCQQMLQFGHILICFLLFVYFVFSSLLIFIIYMPDQAKHVYNHSQIMEEQTHCTIWLSILKEHMSYWDKYFMKLIFLHTRFS